MTPDDNPSASAVRLCSKQQSGFTLVELMVAIAIFGILAAIALPNFSQMIQSQKVRGASSDLFGALIYARSEAIKRNTSISVVRTGAAWEAGWTVQTAGGAVLKRQDPLTAITISGPGGGTVAFGGNGRPTAGSLGDTFMVYVTARPEGIARCVSLSLSGMASVKNDSDTDRTNGC